MRKTALLLALLLVLGGCASKPATSEAELVSSAAELATSSVSSKENQAVAEKEAAEKAAAEKAAAEQAAAEKAAAEQAAEKAAAEQAAAEKAAAEKAAEKAAAEQAAAEKAAAEKAAAEKAAAEQAAAEQEAVSKKAAAKKSGSKKVISGTNFLSKVEKEIITRTNEERVARGFSELAYDVDLHSGARIRSRELCQANLFFHARPDGRSWITVIDEDVPVDYVIAGENLSMVEYNDPESRSASDAEFWIQNWLNSPTHYENMMKPEYTHIGVGVYCIKDGATGFTYAYATTLFAQLPEESE